MTQFLGLSFDVNSLDGWVSVLTSRHSKNGFGYVVTPNVDHIVNYHDSVFQKEIYDSAKFKICDSRIVSLLARLKGKELEAIPGSDLVSELLHSQKAEGLRFAIFGPSCEEFEVLSARFPLLDLEFIEAPQGLVRGSRNWKRLISELDSSQFEILLCCISFPKQEQFCFDLLSSGRKSGFAICAGASLDFLTGKQERAPNFVRMLSLEWLFRLVSDPVRLWRRYLVRGPKIFTLFFKIRD